jgi:hypothetical protein
MTRKLTHQFSGAIQVSLHTDLASYSAASARCQEAGLQLGTVVTPAEMVSIVADMAVLLRAAGTPPVPMSTAGMVRPLLSFNIIGNSWVELIVQAYCGFEVLGVCSQSGGTAKW